MNTLTRLLSFLRFPSALRGLLAIALLLPLLTGCSLPQVRAEDRIFLNLSLEFLGEYRLPKLDFAGTPVGGLSGITYDRQRDRFYAVSDDRSERAPARFYTLKLALGSSEAKQATETANSAIGIQSVEVEGVTILKKEDGNPFAKDTVDLEGIAIAPRQSVFVSSEGVPQNGTAPFIDEFDLKTGQRRSQLPIPARYLSGDRDGTPSGVQSNLGFESLTINSPNFGTGQLEPFRLFTATESALQQDLPQEEAPQSQEAEQPTAAPIPVRFLHYLVGDPRPLLLSEHLYPLDPTPAGATDNGLVDLVTLDQGGHFLSLERTFGITVGVGAQIFELATGAATDTSGVASLKGNSQGITPIYKQRLLNLAELGIALDNLEGMTLGPQLPDGSQSLLLVSDDNFSNLQATQFLLFRVRNK